MCRLIHIENAWAMGFLFVRDHRGFIIAAQCKRLNVIQEPVIAEALASLVAVEFSRDLELPAIILKGDSLQVVQAFCVSEQNFRLYGQIVDEA